MSRVSIGHKLTRLLDISPMEGYRNERFALILVGAGLANSLIAWYLKLRRPELRILLLECNTEIAKNRTWSFHLTDIEDHYLDFKPLVARSWQGYDVHFPSYHRSFKSGYASIRPEKLETALKTILGNDLRFSSKVISVSANRVQLESGEEFEAECVIDGRGQSPISPAGYQKFVGLHLELSESHNLKRPLLMDARVEQRDGYRFFYLLPWSETEILVEDTRYSSTADLSIPEFKNEISNYVEKRGWKVSRLLSTETGVLPIPLQTSYISPLQSGVPKVGAAGGFFHPITGYSLPDSVRLAKQIACLNEVTSESVRGVLINYSRKQSGIRSFFCLLNRMMFQAAPPSERVRIFEHFYRMPTTTIENFYEGQLNLMQRARVLSGKPPVPVLPAIQSIFAKNFNEMRGENQ